MAGWLLHFYVLQRRSEEVHSALSQRIICSSQFYLTHRKVHDEILTM